MPKGSPKTDRNDEIITFAKANDWSYQLIADRFKVSRNVIAGLMFRDRHPKEEWLVRRATGAEIKPAKDTAEPHIGQPIRHRRIKSNSRGRHASNRNLS